VKFKVKPGAAIIRKKYENAIKEFSFTLKNDWRNNESIQRFCPLGLLIKDA